MTEINPEWVETALREFAKPRMTTNMSLDGTRAKLAAALSAVAPLIAAQAWDEGFAEGCRGRMWDSTNPYERKDER